MSRPAISRRMRARRCAYSLRSKGSGTIFALSFLVARPSCCALGGSTDVLARIESVAHRLADEDEQAEYEGEGDEGGDAEPRRLQVRLALREELAERGRAGWQAEAEEVERGRGGGR